MSFIMLMVILLGINAAIQSTKQTLKKILEDMVKEQEPSKIPDFEVRSEMKGFRLVYVVCTAVDGKPVIDKMGGYTTYNEKSDADRVSRQLNNTGIVK